GSPHPQRPMALLRRNALYVRPVARQRPVSDLEAVERQGEVAWTSRSGSPCIVCPPPTPSRLFAIFATLREFKKGLAKPAKSRKATNTMHRPGSCRSKVVEATKLTATIRLLGPGGPRHGDPDVDVQATL